MNILNTEKSQIDIHDAIDNKQRHRLFDIHKVTLWTTNVTE